MGFLDFGRKTTLVDATNALAGRDAEMPISAVHAVLGTAMRPPFPEGMHQAQFALGCFWGAERKFWELPGVYTTAVGYSGGITANPTYEETCSGGTGHTEAVLVVYNPEQISYAELVKVFWENHDPTQGMRQGNDVGTQYRSAAYTYDEEQAEVLNSSRATYETALSERGLGPITTEIGPAGPFFYAEDYHQQYLAKNPGGYCGIGGTGVSCPIGIDG